MPSLTRLPLRSALRALEGLPVEIALEGSGTVLEQEPAAGAPVQKGQTVRIKATPSGWVEAVEPGTGTVKEPEKYEARGTSQGA
jgi:beta-lactam-binding protein with PASTA domain